jgi:hypothetical protein
MPKASEAALDGCTSRFRTLASEKRIAHDGMTALLGPPSPATNAGSIASVRALLFKRFEM